jgi:hypothetical protein
MLSLWDGDKGRKRLLSRLKCPFNVHFYPSKGSKFCDWPGESELQADSQCPVSCVWNYYSLRPLESGYCED